MSELSDHQVSFVKTKEGQCISLGEAKEFFKRQACKCEDRIRESPSKAVLGALALGYVLHRLPLREILVIKVRVLAALAPPVLLLFGAAKLIGCLSKEKRQE